MSHITSVRDRLHGGHGLPALLDTAYTAFELLLSAIEEHEDPASGMFAQFVFAATQAANGRDAILFAPSLPVRPVRPAGTATGGRGSGTDVQDIVTLSKVLGHVLAQAAGAAPGRGDRLACREAARRAAAIHRLLTGAARDQQGYLRRLPPTGSS
jgi:hypothetical protein